jgi:hypothetical protein
MTDASVIEHSNKKQKSNKIPKASHLDKEEAEIASLTNKLLKKHACSAHPSKICLDMMNCHQTLSATQVKLWALSIVCIGYKS